LSSESPLTIAQEGRTLRLTLNRPAKRNALNIALSGAIVEAVNKAQTDTSVSAILLDARGNVFCAGMDLDDTSGASDAHGALFSMGSRSVKPIVMAVNGPALGGGVGLVANGHIVIAAHGVNMGLTEIRIGLWPYFIWPAVVRAIGERRAIAASLTGRIFGVNEALQWGLVHEVTPPFELDDRATAVAAHLGDLSQEVICNGLEFSYRSREAEGGPLALEYRERALASDVFKEGVAAFKQRRKPQFPR
jgi:enoyl-CoA hydratase/carnithine racemase